MITGIGTWPVEGDFFPGVHYGSGKFQPNGASNPVAPFQGTLKDLYTVTHTGTGLLTVTLNSKLKFLEPPVISTASICADGTTNLFQTVMIGDWVNSTHSFVIGLIHAAALADVALNANNWVVFDISMKTRLVK